MSPLALDLFCGAGGVSMGLHRAGFDVVGVDCRPMPRYPFSGRFVQADAMCPPFDLSGFDFIWASPPCQAYSISSHNQRQKGKVYPDLVAAVRRMLDTSGVPYCIENVPGAPIRPDLILDGTMFPGLKVLRVRWFELGGWWTLQPRTQRRPGLITREGWSCVVGHGCPSGTRAAGSRVGNNIHHTIAACRAAMGIDWASRDELSQAIPPPYAEFIGRAFLLSLAQGAAAR